jgi:hypothetical protein
MKLQEYSKLRIQDWNGRKGKNVYSIIKNQIHDLQYLIKAGKDTGAYRHKKLRIYFFKHFYNDPLGGGLFLFECDKNNVNSIICYVSEFRNYSSNNTDFYSEIKDIMRAEFIIQTKHAFEMAQKHYKIQKCEIRKFNY